jgi:hypothetical protein
MRSCIVFGLIVISALAARADDPGDSTRHAYVATQDPWGEPITKVVYLAQNWTPAESLRFYSTPQGSQLIPYTWFLALEQADSDIPFRDIQNILKYRYLAQTASPTNPDGLPVGFVADKGAGRTWLGLTCAACHTNEIRLGTTGYRVDGAPTQADVQGFLTAMIAAMQRTFAEPAKFDRFAARVLGPHNNPANQADLKASLAKSIKIRVGYNLRNFPGFDPALAVPPPPTRFGRLDAVDAIVNEVYHQAVPSAEFIPPTANAMAADAPVSYPFLWDTPQHDRVEWLGIGQSGGPGGIFSLSRNVGEVMGVFGDFIIPDDPSLLGLGYASSVKGTQLGELEDSLKTLWSPLWPSDFPPINSDAAAKGAVLYQKKLENNKSCNDCHALINRSNPNRTVVAKILPTGTDSRAFDNFFKTRRPSGKLNGVNVNFVPFTAKVPPIADANTMVTNAVVGVILGQAKDAPPDQLARINFRGPAIEGLAPGAFPSPAYKARPLNGIWATAPYLHNGSVPNLDALLRPAAQRPTSFSVGTRTFDPVRVGYQTDAPNFPKLEVSPDGTKLGNSNAGHEYGVGLTDEERSQLVEYLKSL